MSDTLMEILGIFIAILIMFIFPVVAVASQHDEIAQTTVKTAVADFVSTVAEKGKITQFDYNDLVQRISSTGNSFDIQIELQVLDDNPERKTVTTDKTIKGEHLYYSVDTENITEKIRDKINKDKEGEYNLKKDDYIIVTVKNTNRTIGTEFKNFFYNIVGKDRYTIAASSASLVATSGKNEAVTIPGGYVDPNEEEDNFNIMIKYHENIPAKAKSLGIITSVTDMPENQEALPDIPITISDKIPIATTNDSYIKLICTGWSTDPDAEVIKYEKGKSYTFSYSEDLYAIWSISLGGLHWKEDFVPNISQINRMPDSYGGSNIHMVGNGDKPGKGAIWTTIASDHLKITEYSFSFSVFCGHSFNAAGLLFNVTETPTTLKGYLFSVNFRDKFTSGGSGSIYKFEYKRNANNMNVEKIELVKQLNIPIVGSDRSANFSGTVAIKVKDSEYLFTSDFSPDITIKVDNMNPKSFGFFSDHMSHGCGDIGSFDLQNIQVKIDFI